MSPWPYPVELLWPDFSTSISTARSAKHMYKYFVKSAS